MKLGVRIHRDELTPKVLGDVRDASFGHVEWDWKWDGNGSHPTPSLDELRAAQRHCHAYDLTLSVAGPNGLSITEKMRPLREVSVRLWREMYAACRDLGALWLVLELGSAGCSPANLALKRGRIEIGAASIAEILDASPDGPRLLIENQRRLPAGGSKCYLGDDPADLAWLVSQSARTGVVFDLGHALINHHPENALSKLAPTVGAFHMHANSGAVDEHRALRNDDVTANRRYWTEMARLVASGIPAVVEVTPLKEACACKRVLLELTEEVKS